MRVIGPRQLDRAQILECPDGPHAELGAVAERESAFRELARLTQLHWVLALSEISKGVVYVTIGDMVIAEDLGEVVRIAATALPEMRASTRVRVKRLARDSARMVRTLE